MKLTKEEAIFYHRQMWSDMQRDLGDCPSYWERDNYKLQWCREHHYSILSNCFLCEYTTEIDSYLEVDCGNICPIQWINNDCCDKEGWATMPISKLLALPERELNEVN